MGILVSTMEILLLDGFLGLWRDHETIALSVRMGFYQRTEFVTDPDTLRFYLIGAFTHSVSHEGRVIQLYFS